MLASNPMRPRPFARAFILGLALGLATSCGDGPDKPPTTSAAATTVATPARTPIAGSALPTNTPDLMGPGPRLGGNVTVVSPQHGSQVRQAATRPSASNRTGLCFEADFKNLPETILWYRLRIDGDEVTTKMTWAVSSQDQPTGGRGCYAPAEGLPIGRHSAAVAVQNPNNPSEPTRQLVTWAFEVIP